MNVSKTRNLNAHGSVYITLDAHEAIILESLIRHAGVLSKQNEAHGHARLCHELADGIAAALPIRQEAGKAVAA